MPYSYDFYFDEVRQTLFGGSLSDQQVKGQEAIIADWEGTYEPAGMDQRWLAYCLATAMHETGQTMWPIEEYGKGSGMEYGKKDPETGQTYYGRGYVQLTWRNNYQRATDELGLSGDDDLVWHAERALDPFIAGHTMFRGSIEGWFRSDDKGRQTLERYFGQTTNDAYGAREIINGDKSKIPSWSNGVSIGNLIKGYHSKFMSALDIAWTPTQAPVQEVPYPTPAALPVVITAPPGLVFVINGVEVLT